MDFISFGGIGFCIEDSEVFSKMEGLFFSEENYDKLNSQGSRSDQTINFHKVVFFFRQLLKRDEVLGGAKVPHSLIKKLKTMERELFVNQEKDFKVVLERFEVGKHHRSYVILGNTYWRKSCIPKDYEEEKLNFVFSQKAVDFLTLFEPKTCNFTTSYVT